MNIQRGFGLIEAMISALIIAMACAWALRIEAEMRRALMCEAGQIKVGCRAVILPDPSNGCQYVVSAGSITPRNDGAGVQMGCKAPHTVTAIPEPGP